MDELEHTAETEPEEQRARDRQQRRAQFVRMPLDEHGLEQLARGGIESEVVSKVVCQRIRVRVEVLLHYK